MGGTRFRLCVAALAVAVLVGSVPTAALAGTATGAAQSETGVGGSIVVADGETVDSIDAAAGSVVVEEGGTVTGDVGAFAGDVRIDGTVEGDVDAAAGNVEIGGSVGGDVSVGAGSVVIADGATVAGALDAGAGSIRIDGRIDGDVTAGAETVRLGDGASIGGDLRYGGSLEGNRDAVAGEITRDPSIGPGVLPTVQPLADWLFAVYALALNLLLGAALLLLFPRFSAGVAERVAGDPLRTGLIGLGVLIGVPILLVVTAITVVGIPFAIVGALLFALIAWVGVVYGRFAVAAWLLSAADVQNRWLALVVGMAGGAVLGVIPYLGGLANFLLFLLGLGALTVGLYEHRRRPGSDARIAGSEGTATD